MSGAPLRFPVDWVKAGEPIPPGTSSTLLIAASLESMSRWPIPGGLPCLQRAVEAVLSNGQIALLDKTLRHTRQNKAVKARNSLSLLVRDRITLRALLLSLRDDASPALSDYQQAGKRLAARWPLNSQWLLGRVLFGLCPALLFLSPIVIVLTSPDPAIGWLPLAIGVGGEIAAGIIFWRTYNWRRESRALLGTAADPQMFLAIVNAVIGGANPKDLIAEDGTPK